MDENIGNSELADTFPKVRRVAKVKQPASVGSGCSGHFRGMPQTDNLPGYFSKRRRQIGADKAAGTGEPGGIGRLQSDTDLRHDIFVLNGKGVRIHPEIYILPANGESALEPDAIAGQGVEQVVSG